MKRVIKQIQNISLQKISQNHITGSTLHSIKNTQQQEKPQYQITEAPWYPKKFEDLKDFGTLMLVNENVKIDHYPQYIDKQYRQRRDEIARISQAHKLGDPLPEIKYLENEHKTWKDIYNSQKEQNAMSCRYLKNLDKIGHQIGFKHGIPQLSQIDAYLYAETGFRLKATHGILSQREFMNALAHKVFICTQYIRHNENQGYSPEPDMIHEIIGHAPMLADPRIAYLSQQFGLISCGIDDEELKKLGNLYWYTLEYGAVKEKDQIKGYGAGIGSSISESEHFKKTKYNMLIPSIHCNRPYIQQVFQPVYMYLNNFDESIDQVINFAESLQKPFKLQFDERTMSICME